MLSPLSREASGGCCSPRPPTARSRSSTPGAEDDHVVRARIAHGLQERGHVGDVVGVARRRVAGEAGFDVQYLRRRFVACALAQKACRDGYSALYTRAQSLFRDLAM